MQTFLPYSDFRASAKSLDKKRLGKQRVEGMQILKVLTGLNKGRAWTNHPAVKMWKGYEIALAEYVYAICDEWTSYGYKDTCKDKVRNIIETYYGDRALVYPVWLRDDKFHSSHKSNLVRKNKNFYGPKFDIVDSLPYIWPQGVSQC